jgi:PiT family inorganic phosphate transporter
MVLGACHELFHALIGGYAGAAIAKGGFGVIIAAGWTKTLIFIFLAPMIGMALGYMLLKTITWLVYKRTLQLLRVGQKTTAAFSSAL